MSDTDYNDHDYTILALNIQGTFFERRCQEIIQEAAGWRLFATNYPVSYQRAGSTLPPKESNLDIRAYLGPTSSYLSSSKSLNLLVECKKNNPEFIEWIFFPARPHSAFFPCIEIKSTQTDSNDAEISSYPFQVSHNLPFADDCWETRGNYSEYKKRKGNQGITRTVNNAVSDAAYQVALATQAVITEEADPNNCVRFNPASNTLVDMKLVLPVIVSTAKLFMCEFDPKDISVSTGEIPFDRVKLTQAPYLIYRYPLPRHLQSDFRFSIKESMIYGSPEVFLYMNIFVVHSENLEGFLSEVPALMSGFLK
ncbi:MAG: hypothetical protein QOH63_437 [Acidobacteriota bacterium]|jgi:hypothetical protein|nr:hypothetical protein [Acidobacteriota bacterium]